ncbi:MAG: hypothetical protein ACETWC_05840 [Acidobacteriota bacterium]
MSRRKSRPAYRPSLWSYHFDMLKLTLSVVAPANVNLALGVCHTEGFEPIAASPQQAE